MLEEIKGPTPLDWTKYLRRNGIQHRDGTHTYEYYPKTNWFKKIYEEFSTCSERHSIEFRATVEYITAGGGDNQDLRAAVLISAMENGEFRVAREEYVYKNFHYNDEFGRRQASVVVRVKGKSVWTDVAFLDGKKKSIYIGSLLEPERDLESIVDQLEADIEDIYEKLMDIKKERYSQGINDPDFEKIDLVICHPIQAVQKLPIKEVDGKHIFTIAIMYDEKNGWMYADYCKPNQPPFHREYIIKLNKNGNDEKFVADAKKYRLRFIDEIHYSLRTLLAHNISWTQAMNDGSLKGSRRRFRVTEDSYTMDGQDFMDVEIWVTKSEQQGFTSKKVTALYRQINGQCDTELLGDYGRDRESLEEILAEFKSSCQATFKELVAKTGKSCVQLLADGTYFNERKRYQIGRFFEALIEYIGIYNQLNEHLFESKERSHIDPKSVLANCEGGLAISDLDLPPVYVLVGMLFRNAYYNGSVERSKLPSFIKVQEVYRRVITFRQRTIEYIQDDPLFRVYSLYRHNTCLAVKNDDDFTVLEEELYKSATTPPTPANELSELGHMIDSVYINELIAKGFVDKSRRTKLESYRGKVFFEAVAKAGSYYGNVERVMEISNDIFPDTNLLIKLAPYFAKDESEDGKPGHEIPYKDPITNGIFMWLEGKIEFKESGITLENSRKALEILKFFEIGQKMFNCTQEKDKKSYVRNPDDLKTRILELDPEIKTHEAFTRRLDTSDASKCMENLVPSREAQHAYIASMNLLMLKWAQDFFETITGVGGNSGAGKTTFTQGKTVSYDKWRYLLRKGTEILPSQDFAECSQRFNEFLKFIIEETDLKYTLDLRFLEPKFVRDNIIVPAQLRGGDKGKMIYLITPLQTSLLRMLARPADGPEPAQGTSIITSGYKTLHKNFEAIIELMNREEAISFYDIYYKHGTAFTRIASKRGDTPEIVDNELFEKCKVVPTDDEIKAIEETIITEVLISEAILSGEIFKEQEERLKSFIGQKLGEAVNKNARGGK